MRRRGTVRAGPSAAFHRGFQDGVLLGLCLGGGLVLVVLPLLVLGW